MPGLAYERWTFTDARGPVRGHLLTFDLDQPGLRLDYAAPATVPARQPLTRILAEDGAVAGVNGDFFDIADTGAPLGVGRDLQERLRHGPAAGGWHKSFWLDATGEPAIGDLPVTATVREHPDLVITNLNSPTVRVGGIGVYRRAWGTTVGARVVDGQRRDVREVVVDRRGVVVSNRTRLSTGVRIDGTVLIGRGPGAEALRALRPGTSATVRPTLPTRTSVAISGSVFLVRDDVVKAINDVDLHPRTAIGVDREERRLVLLVVDGRYDGSRGFTLVETARFLHELGVEDAVNLDGGGSSTMVARRPDGRTAVVNRPSDGAQRAVPNGLAITWSPPRRR